MEHKRTIPRAAALHDLSCFGRCALTVIDPVLSALGVQCVPVPTALLSTHTGGFRDMYFCELDSAIPRIADHFEATGIRFDAVYTGFLGSARQAEIIEDFIRRFGQDDGNGGTPTVLVDPVLGDDGELSRKEEVAGVSVRNLDELSLLALCLYILSEYYFHFDYLPCFGKFRRRGSAAPAVENYFFFI